MRTLSKPAILFWYFCNDIFSCGMALLIWHLYMRPEVNSNRFEISLWSKISLWCKGFFAGAVLMEFSKAFECMPHDLLIAKLNAYGFDRKCLAFFYSYLKRRKQRVNMKNMQSAFQTLLSGVPHGSILGLLLFNIFINDLIGFIKSLHYTILQMITQ